MAKNFSLLLIFIALLVWIPAQGSADQLTILHTNDTHSHLYPFGPMNKYGGIARMSYLIKELKRKNRWAGRSVVTLNSGDVFVGTFAFNKYLGYAELKIMEGLYDVMALGNHEFDLGVDNLTGIFSGVFSGNAPVELPALCANIKNLDSSHPLHQFVKPYRIQQVGPFKIGFIGVVTTDEYNYSPEVNSILTDPYEAAGEAAFLLRQQGCDVVVCLSHLGIEPDRQGLAWVPGIDIIVGGHSHTALTEAEVVNGKIIVQAGEFGKHLGELRVDVKPDGVALVDYKLHPVGRKVRRDLAGIPILCLPIARFGFFVNEQIACKAHRRTRGTQQIGMLCGLTSNLHRNSIVNCRAHLGSYKSPPDQLVHTELVPAHVRLDVLRQAQHGGRSDGFMGFLRPLRLSAVCGEFLRHVVLTVPLNDVITRFLLGELRDIGRIRAHIGDEANRLTIAEVYAFIKLLGNRHRPARS